MATIERPKNAALDAVLATALDAVMVMRMDGTIACWNDNAERVFGWTSADVEGRRMSETIIPPRYREAHEQGLTRYLATGAGPVLDQRIEISAVHRAGHELPVELSITHSNHFGEPLFLGFLRDISERHEAQRRRELMMGELNHRVKNMLAVVAGIAHQTALSSDTIEVFQRGFLGRLESLGAAHDLLMAGEWRDEAALAAIAEIAPDVVMLDINLGRGIDGVETARRMREAMPVTVLFVSAYDDEATRARIAEQVPGAHFLGKPVFPGALAMAIEAATKRAH
ncbi:MAG: PAS domain S-box protein [Sphingomonadaceae bacterium]|nr:PAS domain S-box protein [Sphingomonadaceae bacterium]